MQKPLNEIIDELQNELSDKTLSFGCLIKKSHSRRKYSGMINASNEGYLPIVTMGGSSDNWSRICYKNAFGDIITLKGKYKIIGHPVTLEDVLKALWEKYGEWYVSIYGDGFINLDKDIKWIPNKPLPEQPEATLRVLHNLIFKK